MRDLDPDDPEQWIAYLRERLGMQQQDELLSLLPAYRRTPPQSRLAEPVPELAEPATR